MINEIWKPIEGYEGRYEVSNLGRVKSLGNNKSRREKILSPGKNNCGYLQVRLCKNCQKERLLVHRLVGKAFVPGYFEGAVINHKDHNQENNVYTNLEWTTQKQNTSREKSFGPEILARLNSKKVIQFAKDGTFIREWPSTHEVERQLGYNRGNISMCCLGKRYKSVNGFVWKYKEETNA